MAIIISGISLPFQEPPETALERAKKQAGVRVMSAVIAKRSVDARRKKDIRFVYSVRLLVSGNEAELVKGLKNGSVAHDFAKPDFSHANIKNKKPVIAGFGPAGMFAALTLARAGLQPVVIERGAPIDERVRDVSKLSKTGRLHTESNIQFGEGGAGTFSDGKLTTRTNDALGAFVLNEFVKHGAPKEILTQANPHIGTDLLRGIVKSIREEIRGLGGEVHFHTRLDDIVLTNGALSAVMTTRGEIVAPSLILAPGHSARDMFEMLFKRGAQLLPKPFSVGLRIEHLQSEVDKALYGDFAGHELLPKAEYRHSLRIGGRAAYTFCMCPGGVVVPAASEDGGVVTNGMSGYERSGENANSALVVSVSPGDTGGVFGGMEFQRKLERAAFDEGGGGYAAPVQDTGSFLNGNPGFVPGKVMPSYLPGVAPGDFAGIFPHHIIEMLKQGITAFDRRQTGFASPGGVLTGVETRTSSPVRILRNANFQAAGLAGIYPCGEGAGYAGGIMSAAVDGIKCAEALANR